MINLLQLIKDVCDEVGLPRPTAVIGTSDAEVRQLFALTSDAADEIRALFNWVELTKEHTFTTTNGVASYALPADYDKLLEATAFDRSTTWQMMGGLTPQEWQFRKSGLVQTSIYQNFRIQGVSSTQLKIDPTPSDTRTLVFEYQSKNWILPVIWTASTAFTANSYCSYNGNIYKTTSAGTTGSTAPTHTTGDASDGAVTWSYYSGEYSSFTADTDLIAIDQRVVKKFIKWMWQKANGLDYQESRSDAFGYAAVRYAETRGARTLGTRPTRDFRYPNTPDRITGY